MKNRHWVAALVISNVLALSAVADTLTIETRPPVPTTVQPAPLPAPEPAPGDEIDPFSDGNRCPLCDLRTAV